MQSERFETILLHRTSQRVLHHMWTRLKLVRSTTEVRRGTRFDSRAHSAVRFLFLLVLVVRVAILGRRLGLLDLVKHRGGLGRCDSLESRLQLGGLGLRLGGRLGLGWLGLWRV